MADEAGAGADPGTSDPLLGPLDILLLVALGVGAAYWFFFRKKKEDVPAIKKMTMPTVQKIEDKGFIAKLKSSGRNLIVFYGSQTGTAEEFAGRIAKEGGRYGLKGMAADPEECNMEDLPKLADIENSLVIFCMATYGEGDPTDNAQEFYDMLQSGDLELTGVNYAVFGLGNKTYEHFNSMGNYVDTRLEELGAKRVFECGMGDDDGNIEEDFVAWKERFWPSVCEHFGIEATGDDINMRQYGLILHDEKPDRVFTGETARLGSFETQKPPFDPKNPFLSPVSINRELHKGGGRSCLHIELDITGSRIRYEAGDHVAVFPINDADLVNKIGELTGVDLDTVFTLKNLDEEASKKHPFPCPCSYRTALMHYVDITGRPRTHVLKELAEYAQDPKDKEFLIKMSSSSTEGKNLYNEWILKDCRNIVSILEDLPSLKPAMDHICELLPRLQSRYYSISSSPKKYPNSIHVTAAILEYETPTGRVNKGVATSWLAVKKPEDNVKCTVPIFVRRSQFRLPFKPATPIIMIGPGTGLAPFRGFIQERQFSKESGKNVGSTILFTGCRKQSEDFIYQEEIEQYIEDGTISQFFPAFSRDTPNKVYVQHLMANNKECIWKILSDGGHIYVCGDAKNMARDVHSVLLSIVQECGGKEKTAAESFVKNLQSKGRFSQDVWS